MRLLFIFLSLFLSCETTDEIYNKILTDKFFRGIVADNLIENKKYADIGEIKEFETYSELRGYVISLVEKNPKKAAELFSGVVKETGGYKIVSENYEYEINPVFKSLIDQMKRASSDNSIGDESRRVLSSTLFEGVWKKPDGDLSITSNNTEINDYRVTPEYNSLDLNVNKLLSEKRNIDSIWNYLNEYSVRDINDILKNTQSAYLKFSKYVSSISGMKKINPEQSKSLISIINEVSKYLKLKVLVIRYRELEERIMALKSIRLKNSLSDLYNRMIDLSSKNNSTEFDREFMSLFSDMDTIASETTVLNNVYDLKNNLERYYPSCFYDWLVYKINYYIYPSKKFLVMMSQKKDILLLLNKIISGYEKNGFDHINSNLLITEKKSLDDAFKLIEDMNEIKNKNRKIQYYFFDNLIPYDIYTKNGKRYFGLKYAEEIKKH
ncbi:MAG: hypothetical protein GX445_00720 [Elusimicrobia bacterium]|jgi:hypothetical protein|nr:hypothetical protein [Elusimicrobiota bacterium]